MDRQVPDIDRTSRLTKRRLRLWALAVAMLASGPAAAQGHRLEACSRGDVQVCSAILARPRLEPGRRAAIEFHLAEIERQLGLCLAGDESVCATMRERYPDLPPALRPDAPSPVQRK